MKKFFLQVAQSYLFLIMLAGLIVSFFNPHSEWMTSMDQVLVEPNLKAWFGYDALGRNLFFRSLLGAQVSLTLGLISALLSLIFGFLYASFAVSGSKRREQILMRAVEIFSSVPQFVLICVMVLGMQNLLPFNSYIEQLSVLILVLSLCSWMNFARLSRNLMIQVKEQTFIQASEAMGASKWWIIKNHYLPNVGPTLFVMWGLQVPSFILFESMLSFIGIGLRPPMASWGVLIQEGWRTLSTYPHLILGPGLMLFLTVLSLNLLFENFRKQKDPWLKDN